MFTLRHARMRFAVTGTSLEAVLYYDDRPGRGWRFAMRDLDSAATGVVIDAPAGSDLFARLEAVILHRMPVAVLADALDDAGPRAFAWVAAWLRDERLSPIEVTYG